MNSMCSKDFQGNHVYTGLEGKWEHIKLITNEYCICIETFSVKHTAVNILLYLYLQFCVYSECSCSLSHLSLSISIANFVCSNSSKMLVQTKQNALEVINY